jgi:hypothetical protein
MDKQECQECRKLFNKNELIWVNDSHNIPFKKVCSSCENKTREELKQAEKENSWMGEQVEEDPEFR